MSFVKTKTASVPAAVLESSGIPEIPECLQALEGADSMVTLAQTDKLTYRRAGHVCLWARQRGRSDFGVLRAAVMMQLRFDGTFGFPGGLVDAGEDVTEGINRELKEEICFDATTTPVTWRDYHSSQVVHESRLVLHFFIKELSLQQFCAIEQSCPKSQDYGNEVMGIVRVPLYTMTTNTHRGLPAFLTNKFIGTAKLQLLLSLHHTNLLSTDEIHQALLRSQHA